MNTALWSQVFQNSWLHEAMCSGTVGFMKPVNPASFPWSRVNRHHEANCSGTLGFMKPAALLPKTVKVISLFFFHFMPQPTSSVPKPQQLINRDILLKIKTKGSKIWSVIVEPKLRYWIISQSQGPKNCDILFKIKLRGLKSELSLWSKNGGASKLRY